MKNKFIILFLLLFPIISNAQITTDIKTLYPLSMKEYELGHYKKAAEKFQIIIDNYKFDEMSSRKLYNGAFIFS